jgi:hypothetical protein
MRYLNGSRVYLSSIHPIVLETQELEREKIDVVISLLEERDPPGFIKQALTGCKHYYYHARDNPDEPIQIWFINTFNVISRALENNLNILIYCRSGKSLCVTILTAFLIRALSKGLYRYMVYDCFHYLPKSKYTWTESFLDYLQTVYPNAEPNTGFMSVLLELERDLIRVPHEKIMGGEPGSTGLTESDGPPEPPGLDLSGVSRFQTLLQSALGFLPGFLPDNNE